MINVIKKGKQYTEGGGKTPATIYKWLLVGDLGQLQRSSEANDVNVKKGSDITVVT